MERDSRKQIVPKGIAIVPPHGRRQRVGREMESSSFSSVSLSGHSRTHEVSL